MNEVATVQKGAKVEAAWGEANPVRGLNYHTVARKFIRDFPIGTTLTNEKFDHWAHQAGYLNVPFGAPTGSDVWLAHLQRRHQLRANLYKASTHPRMQEMGEECFVLSRAAGGTMIVESTGAALTHGHFATKLDSLIGTKRRHLSYLMQSADVAQMLPWQRAIAEELFNEIDEWNEDVQRKTYRLDSKFTRLVNQIKHDVESGAIKQVNHGIERLIAAEDPQEE